MKNIDRIADNGYQIIELYKTGSYGEIYKVRDKTGSIIACKVCKSDAEDMDIDVLYELDILNRLNHPNIIHGLNFMTFENISDTVIFMPLGIPLHHYHHKIFRIEHKLTYISKIANGLKFMHKNGILHLDIKPSNFIVINDQPYFIDFGTCMYTDSVNDYVFDKRLRVTKGFRPPELCVNSKEVFVYGYNGAVDIFAFGMLCYCIFIERSPLNSKLLELDDYKNYREIADITRDAVDMINKLLYNKIPEQYRTPCINFLKYLLDAHHLNRPSAKSVCKFSLIYKLHKLNKRDVSTTIKINLDKLNTQTENYKTPLDIPSTEHYVELSTNFKGPSIHLSDNSNVTSLDQGDNSIHSNVNSLDQGDNSNVPHITPRKILSYLDIPYEQIIDMDYSPRSVNSDEESFKLIQSPKSIVCDEQSPRSIVCDEQSPKSIVCDEQSPRSIVCDEQSPRSIVCDEKYKSMICNKFLEIAIDHREIIASMVSWGKNYFISEKAEILFLAVDIYHRISENYSRREQRLNIALACLLLAYKFINGQYVNPRTIPYNKHQYDKYELEIINHLRGIINVSNLYKICRNGSELQVSLHKIILHDDPSVYVNLDFIIWSKYLETYVTNPVFKSKNIIISQLFVR